MYYNRTFTHRYTHAHTQTHAHFVTHSLSHIEIYRDITHNKLLLRVTTFYLTTMEVTKLIYYVILGHSKRFSDTAIEITQSFRDDPIEHL